MRFCLALGLLEEEKKKKKTMTMTKVKGKKKMKQTKNPEKTMLYPHPSTVAVVRIDPAPQHTRLAVYLAETDTAAATSGRSLDFEALGFSAGPSIPAELWLQRARRLGHQKRSMCRF